MVTIPLKLEVVTCAMIVVETTNIIAIRKNNLFCINKSINLN